MGSRLISRGAALVRHLELLQVVEPAPRLVPLDLPLELCVSSLFLSCVLCACDQYCIVYGIHKAGRGGVVYCPIVVH